MTVSLSPLARQQFNQGGIPLAGGKVYTYAAGTTNKLATFTDSTGSTPNTNPIILDANGQCDLWLADGSSYKVVLSPPTDTDPPTNAYWTRDNISNNLIPFNPTFNNVTVVGTLAVTGAVTLGSTINKITLTQPANAATITIANNKTLTVSNTVTFSSTDGATVNFGAGGTAVMAGLATASGLTQNTARLLGRTTAGIGSVEEISVGAGLNLSAGILIAVQSGMTLGSTVTDNFTINVTTQTIYPVAMTAIGKCLTAPDSTTLTKGLMYVLDNTSGGYPFGFRDSTGVLRSNCIGAGGIGQVYLDDNSTAAGVWRVVGSNIEPGLVTIDSTFSSTYGPTVYPQFAALDSNKSIHFLKSGSNAGFYAVAVDKTTGAVGTPLLIASNSGYQPKICFKIDANTVIVFYGDSGTNFLSAVPITLSSVTTLTLGTLASNITGSLTDIGAEDFVGPPKIAQLASSTYLISFAQGTGASNTSVVAVSVSGTTATAGSVANIIGSNSILSSTTTYALTATTGLVLYKSGASAPYANNAVIVTVTGNTCALGAPAALTNVGSSLTSIPSSCLLSATKCLVEDDNNTAGSVIASVFTISGTTVTAGTLVSVETGITTSSSYSANSATRYNPHLFPLTSSTALLWYLDSSSISRVVVLSESAGTVTAGSILYRSFSQAASGATGFGTILSQGTSDFLSAVQVGASAAWKNIFVPHKISGTTITYGDSTSFSEFSPVSLVTALPTTKLSAGDYLTMGANVNAVPVLRSNGDAINKRGSISIPNLSTPTTYPLAGVASNRLVLMGSTQGTSVSSTTQQLRLLNMEIAA